MTHFISFSFVTLLLLTIIAQLNLAGSQVLISQDFNSTDDPFNLSANNGSIGLDGSSESTFSGVSDGKALRVVGGGDNDPVAYGPAAICPLPDLGMDETWVISFDFKQESGKGILFQLFDSTGNKGINLYLSHWSDGFLQYIEGGGNVWRETGINLADGDWYRIEFKIMPSLGAEFKSYELSVRNQENTEIFSQNFNFSSEISEYSHLRWSYGFTGSEADAVFALDNFSLKIEQDPIDIEVVVEGEFSKETRIRWNGKAGELYSIQTVQDLSAGQWSTMASGLRGYGSELEQVLGANAISGFYRVVLDNSAIPMPMEFHVSPDGDDNSPGTRDKPFATIQKAASVMIQGDVCFIHSGTYPESVRPSNSGTEANSIIFQPVDESAEVVITGADPIPHESWERVGENTFKAVVDMPLGDGNQVFLGGDSMVVARWPNLGDDPLRPALAIMDNGTSSTAIVDAALPDYDYVGGYVWVHAREYWSNWTTPILQQQGSSLEIQNRAPYPGPRQHVTRPGAQFFVFGIKDALDAENEWYYDSGAKELFVYRDGGELPEQLYYIKRRSHVLDVSSRQNLEFRDITILGSSILTDESSENLLFDGLKMHYPYFSTLGQGLNNTFVLKGRNITIQNSEIAYSSGSCLTMEGENNKLLNSFIHDGNLFGAFVGNVYLGGKGNVISHCTITRSGRTLINYSKMYQALIQHCELSEAGLLTADLGLTYGSNIEAGNSEVRFNLMHDNRGRVLDKNMGLYYDHATKNIISHHNIIWGVSYAALLINHYAAGHLVYNNTFIGGTNGFRSVWGNQYSPDLLNCRFVNNLFSKNAVTTAENHYWNNNVEGYTGFDEGQIMKGYAPGFGEGVFLEGISIAGPSSQPGIGAIEYDGMTFEAGHNFENIPDMDFTRSLPLYRNRLENTAFEHEDHFFPWEANGDTVTVFNHPVQNHTKPDVAIGRAGSYSVGLTKQGAELFQKVEGLEPGKSFEFLAHLRVDDGADTVLGIRLADGTEYLSPAVSSGSPNWTRTRVSFLMPDEAQPVKVFVRRINGDESKEVYVDELSLTML